MERRIPCVASCEIFVGELPRFWHSGVPVLSGIFIIRTLDVIPSRSERFLAFDGQSDT
jgi:hypothetical protein